jgi:DNA polymerase-3 subunit epsilon
MKKILIIDIETTGFNPYNEHIVEIGIVELDLETGDTKILLDEFVKEEGLTKDILDKSWICKNGFIDPVDVMDYGIDWSEVKEATQDIINMYPLGATAYNNKFDFGFLDARGIDQKKKLPCPMILSTPVCKIKHYKGNGYKWPTCEEAYNHFFPDAKYIELHRGADDAMHEAKIVHELYKLGKFKL